MYLHFNVITPFWRGRKGYVTVAPLPVFVVIVTAAVVICSSTGADVVLVRGVITDLSQSIHEVALSLYILLLHRSDVKVTVCICNIEGCYSIETIRPHKTRSQFTVFVVN